MASVLHLKNMCWMKLKDFVSFLRVWIFQNDKLIQLRIVSYVDRTELNSFITVFNRDFWSYQWNNTFSRIIKQTWQNLILLLDDELSNDLLIQNRLKLGIQNTYLCLMFFDYQKRTAMLFWKHWVLTSHVII